MFTPPDLTGRVAIVTGASRGVGRSVAVALARAGCDVAVAARTERSSRLLPGSIHETCDAISALGRRAIAVRTDVRDAAQIAALIDQAVKTLGRVDILINNAGALWWHDVADTPIERFDLLMAVNARAAFAASQHCIPHMLAQGWGHIVNMAPPLAPPGGPDARAMAPGRVAYTISKLGMTLLAHGLAEEVRGTGVAVNALWPATLVESQAVIGHHLGGPAQWRKADVVADAVLAIVARDPALPSGRALIDEEVLRDAGVTDFDRYLCVPDGRPVYIIGAHAVDPGALG